MVRKGLNMKKHKLLLFFVLILGIFGLSPNPFSVGLRAQEKVGTGLVLATPEQLRGIPVASRPYAGFELPASVDLSKDMPPPGHQGSQNSCVGWSLAYALKSYQEKIEEGLPYVRNGQVDAARVFSPSFVYNQINKGQNIPISFIDAFNVLSKQGAATWADMPYRNEDYTSMPSTAVRERAKRYSIDYWRLVNIQDTTEVKTHLHAGFPVVIGAKIDKAFISLPAGKLWNSIGEVIGAHAMVVVGYDDSLNAFKLMNSWGSGWGDNGFCWVDYDHFRQVVNEGYVAKDALNGPPMESQQQTEVISQQRQERQAVVTLTNVLHNTYIPDRPDLGYFMKFEGTIDIPPGLGQTDQVAVYFYFDTGGGQRGWPVQSLDRTYSDPNGYAACGTAVYPVPAQRLQTTWQCWIPYSALNTPVGQWVNTMTGPVYQPVETNLLAEAVLFVDNFGVARGPLLSFYVRK
jgi:hypothetical protein